MEGTPQQADELPTLAQEIDSYCCAPQRQSDAVGYGTRCIFVEKFEWTYYFWKIMTN
jgi:hypothetical protein